MVRGEMDDRGLYNGTTNASTSILHIQIPQGSFVGTSAESVIEDDLPTWPLPDYGTALMEWEAYDSNGHGHILGTDVFWNALDTDSSGQTLANASEYSSDETSWVFVQSE